MQSFQEIKCYIWKERVTKVEKKVIAQPYDDQIRFLTDEYGQEEFRWWPNSSQYLWYCENWRNK